MGMISAREALKSMLAKCVALRNWNGANYTDLQIRDRIHFDVLPDPANGVSHTREEYQAFRPFVLLGINAANPYSIKRDASGSTMGSWAPSGSFMIAIDQAVNPDAAEQENEESFQSLIDAVISTGDPNNPGLVEQIGLAESLSITEITVEGIFRMMPEEVVSKGDAQRAYIRVEWGVK